jgi:D-amino-acid dehydrogenase
MLRALRFNSPRISHSMKVLVLGGGVIGVASTYYLQRAGHEVTLVERQPDVARETSYANGGQISWGAAAPWAAPGMPRKAIAWLFRPNSPLVLRPRLDPTLWAWLARMLGQCTTHRYLNNRERQLRLTRYSHERLVQLRADTGLTYDERTRGVLVLYRQAQELEAALREHALLEHLGIETRLLEPAACIAHEPGLASSRVRLAGGLLFPYDESGDCRRFTEALALMTKRHGAVIKTNTTVLGFDVDGNNIRGAITDSGTLRADAYVLACGSYSPLLLRSLGIRLPVYPVKGYSISAPIVNDAQAPQGTLTDETYKTVITRLGPQLRAAGTAELGGYDLTIQPDRIATLKHVVQELFPAAANLNGAETWAGLRPMTPDNPPVLGATPYANLFLNTGHGTLGWTMACGSGKIVTDILSGRSPEIDLDGLTLARFA